MAYPNKHMNSITLLPSQVVNEKQFYFRRAFFLRRHTPGQLSLFHIDSVALGPLEFLEM